MKYKKKWKPALRLMINPAPLKKKSWTWERNLFIEIAEQRQVNWSVIALHMDTNGNETYKMIRLEDLTPFNFDHTIPKSRGEKYRLDPSNILIVSFAWHFYKHFKQVYKLDRRN